MLAFYSGKGHALFYVQEVALFYVQCALRAYVTGVQALPCFMCRPALFYVQEVALPLLACGKLACLLACSVVLGQALGKAAVLYHARCI